MKDNKKYLKLKGKNISSSFSGTKLTMYAGLSPIMKYIRKDKMASELNELFPTIQYNSTKFSFAQLMLSVILASLSGINRLSRIAVFTHDELMKNLLGLKSGLNKDVIGQRFKELGQKGAIYLHEYSLQKVNRWLTKSRLRSITLCRVEVTVHQFDLINQIHYHLLICQALFFYFKIDLFHTFFLNFTKKCGK